MAEWLNDLPLWWANVFTVALFAGIAVGTFRIPRRRILEDAPDESRWRDLRWWVLLLIAAQLGLYSLF